MLKIKLKDIGVFYNGLKGKKLSDFSENYPDKYIDFKSILNGNINISELPCVKINDGEQQNVVKRNDLLINMTSENIDDIGLCNIYCYDEKVYLNSFSQGFRVCDSYDPHYISYLLKSPNYRRKIKKQSQGITRINLAPSRLGNIDLLIHNYHNQKKIGSFFKELDELIEIEEKSTEKLIALQKYFINAYFKSIDREVKLSNVIVSKSGHSLEKYKSENGEYKFISIGNYSQDGLYIDDGSRIDITNKTEPYLVNKNDLVMVLNDKTKDGKIIGSTILCEEKMVFNQRSQKIVPGEQILPYFLWLQLNSNDFREKVKRMAQGGTQIYINFPSIEKLTIKVPELEEQKYITNFFKEFSTLISLRKEKTVELKNMKKYYLNKIFN